MFTLVLRGHIDCASIHFPEGINGIRIDTLARQPLWQQGYDFSHGTGHGVGHFLNVHEGPAGIGYKKISSEGAIRPRMVLTIEPGYYEAGNFGIRIENCYEVVKVEPTEHESGAKNFLAFSPLTYVPVQKDLIDKSLLAEKHIHWLNSYHNRCLELVGKYLQERNLQEEYNFLAQACTPL